MFDRYETTFYQLLSGKRLGEIGGYSQFELDELQPQLQKLAFTEDMAVDWITGNIYYTRLNSINVVDSDLTLHELILEHTRSRITAIALHPIDRYSN